MDRENTIIIAAVIFIFAVVMFSPRETETTEPQKIKIGVLTNTQANASEVFLVDQAINEVNKYCLNHSLPYQFTPVYKCSKNSQGDGRRVPQRRRVNNFRVSLGEYAGYMRLPEQKLWDGV